VVQSLFWLAIVTAVSAAVAVIVYAISETMGRRAPESVPTT